MRIAVLGDVQGNRFALEAVVQDIERHAPDAWVNLGDHADCVRFLRIRERTASAGIRCQAQVHQAKPHP